MIQTQKKQQQKFRKINEVRKQFGEKRKQWVFYVKTKKRVETLILERQGARLNRRRLVCNLHPRVQIRKRRRVKVRKEYFRMSLNTEVNGRYMTIECKEKDPVPRKYLFIDG